eukprot:g7153.t1
MNSIVHESLTKLDAALLLCEFLECAVHQILASRKLYDARLFEDSKLYNLIVRRSLYPKLNDYIHRFIYSLKDNIKEGSLNSLEVLFLDKNRTIVETFVINLKGRFETLEFHQLEDCFRLVTVSIVKSISSLSSLPDGCEFDLLMKTKKGTLPLQQQSIWCIHDSFDQSHLQYMEPIKTTQFTSNFRLEICRKTSC